MPNVEDGSGDGDRVLIAAPVAVLTVTAREDVVIAREIRALAG